MEKLPIGKELYFKIVDYMTICNLSYRTIREYSRVLRIVFKKYEYIDQKLTIKLLKKHRRTYEVAALKMINSYCLYANIDFRIIIPKIKKIPRKIPTIFTSEEVKIIISSAPAPYDLLIRCIFNFGAGLRVSEIIKFSWGSIEWARWLKDKDFGIATIKNSKGGKSRKVNIPKKLMMDLYEYAKEQRLLNEFGIPNGSLIFKCGMGANFKEELFGVNREKWKFEYLKHAYDWIRYNIIRKHCEKALGKKIKIHALRSSRATYLYEVEKVPIEKIQILLGHADIKTTLIYTEISNKNIFDTVKNVGEL